jgi:hypothetical protein
MQYLALYGSRQIEALPEIKGEPFPKQECEGVWHYEKKIAERMTGAKLSN